MPNRQIKNLTKVSNSTVYYRIEQEQAVMYPGALVQAASPPQGWRMYLIT